MKNSENTSRISVVRAANLEEAKQKLALHSRPDPQFYPGGKKTRTQRRKNWIGTRNGKLEVLAVDETSGGRNLRWIAICECGNFVGLTLDNLKRKKCCGCDKFTRASNAHSTHRGTNTKEFNVWYGMKRRCRDKSIPSYVKYGGRGIKVCERWDPSFANFLEDMGRCPDGMTLDRINNDGNYEPGNVRWATAIQQAQNKRSNRVLEFNGKSMCATAWGRLLGIKPKTIMERLRKGMGVEKSLTVGKL
jgi:hypothetical protein